MLRTETVSPELLKALKELMGFKTLQNFRLAGGTALSLQFGHRKSDDIDLFTSNNILGEDICAELIEKFKLKESVKPLGGIMIRTITNEGVKIDIVNNNDPFIRDTFIEDGIRMVHPEDIAASKIKIACDPFSGRKTKKDLADIAVLLDKYSLKQMAGFFKEKFPTMAPYEENAIVHLKNFNKAEETAMPLMLNGMTWEMIKQKIEKSLKSYFEDILKDRENKLKGG